MYRYQRAAHRVGVVVGVDQAKSEVLSIDKAEVLEDLAKQSTSSAGQLQHGTSSDHISNQHFLLAAYQCSRGPRHTSLSTNYHHHHSYRPIRGKTACRSDLINQPDSSTSHRLLDHAPHCTVYRISDIGLYNRGHTHALLSLNSTGPFSSYNILARILRGKLVALNSSFIQLCPI